MPVSIFHLAGRIASPVDEALIPPVVIRPARSRALPLIDRVRGRARVLAGRIASPVDEAWIPPVVIRPVRSRALPIIDSVGGRARVLAGRIASPVDEALIPPPVIRPARSRALPMIDTGPVSRRLSMKRGYLQLSYGPPGVGPYRQKRPRIAEPFTWNL
jgi:hypothetical protein